MKQRIPHLAYLPKTPAGKFSPCITMDKKIIHEIADMNLFYEELGYSDEWALKGIWPDEFIWETYFRHSDKLGVHCVYCYQLNVIGYLLKYSKKFAQQYWKQAAGWIATYTNTIEMGACINEKCLDKSRCHNKKEHLDKGMGDLLPASQLVE